MNDFSDSDQVWLDRLSAGSAPRQAPANAAEREADALRRAIALDRRAEAADPVIAAATSDEARERRWQQLQFRLRREALTTTRRTWLMRAGFGGALAAGLLAAVLLAQRFGDSAYYDEPPTMRGEIEAVRVRHAQPRQAAEALAGVLRATGQPVLLHQDGKIFGIDTDVTSESPAAALDALMAFGAKARPGTVRIEFAPR
jgi:hypothetical protein